MCQWVSIGFYIPSTIDELLLGLCCFNRVQHDIEIPTGWVFHTTWSIYATGNQTMFLVFYTTCTNGMVGNDITHIPMVGWIQHFISCCEACFFNNMGMHLTNCNQTSHKIWCLFWIWLMQHSFIPFTCSTWFIGINSWHNKDLIFYFFLNWF